MLPLPRRTFARTMRASSMPGHTTSTARPRHPRTPPCGRRSRPPRTCCARRLASHLARFATRLRQRPRCRRRIPRAHGETRPPRRCPELRRYTRRRLQSRPIPPRGARWSPTRRTRRHGAHSSAGRRIRGKRGFEHGARRRRERALDFLADAGERGFGCFSHAASSLRTTLRQTRTRAQRRGSQDSTHAGSPPPGTGWSSCTASPCRAGASAPRSRRPGRWTASSGTRARGCVCRADRRARRVGK